MEEDQRRYHGVGSETVFSQGFFLGELDRKSQIPKGALAEILDPRGCRSRFGQSQGAAPWTRLQGGGAGENTVLKAKELISTLTKLMVTLIRAETAWCWDRKYLLRVLVGLYSQIQT